MNTTNVRFGALAFLLFVVGSLFGATLHAQTPCVFTISPSSGSHNAGTLTGLVSVATSADCAWNALNTNAWISLLSGSNCVGYGVSANPASSARVGYLLIRDQSFAVTQQGVPCNYGFSPTGATVEHAASTNYISVTTPTDCMWAAGNHNIVGQKSPSGSTFCPKGPPTLGAARSFMWSGISRPPTREPVLFSSLAAFLRSQ